jgi:hypothetical protein
METIIYNQESFCQICMISFLELWKPTMDNGNQSYEKIIIFFPGPDSHRVVMKRPFASIGLQCRYFKYQDSSLGNWKSVLYCIVYEIAFPCLLLAFKIYKIYKNNCGQNKISQCMVVRKVCKILRSWTKLGQKASKV